MISISALASVLVLVVLVVLYPNRSVGTKPSIGLPGPKGWPLIGNLVLILLNKSRLVTFLHEMQEAYGPLYTFTVPYWGRITVINRPEWLEHARRKDTVSYIKGSTVQDVFNQYPGPTTPVATDGAAWRTARKRMQAVFSSKCVHNHAHEAMRDLAPVIQDFLKDANDKGIAFDWNDFCGRITIEIFCKTAFSLDLQILTPDVACLDIPAEINDSVWTLNQITNARLFNPLWRITQFFDGTYWKFSASKNYLHNVVRRLISDRRSAGKEYGDYLDVLLSVEKKHDPKQIEDTLMVLLLAGRESTLGLFVWAIYELCRAPQWISLLRKEIEILGTESDIISFEEAGKYQTHRAVIFETLRLWPGLPKNARVAMEDDVLPSIEIANLPAVKISKGDFVLWCDYSMMRSIDIWGPDAGEFNPGRHLDANGRFVAPKAPKFHGFGFGPRSCPGEALSTYEFISIISLIIREFDIVPVKHEKRVFAEALTAFMDGPFYVTVKPREETILP